MAKAACRVLASVVNQEPLLFGLNSEQDSFATVSNQAPSSLQYDPNLQEDVIQQASELEDDSNQDPSRLQYKINQAKALNQTCYATLLIRHRFYARITKLLLGNCLEHQLNCLDLLELLKSPAGQECIRNGRLVGALMKLLGSKNMIVYQKVVFTLQSILLKATMPMELHFAGEWPAYLDHLYSLMLKSTNEEYFGYLRLSVIIVQKTGSSEVFQVLDDLLAFLRVGRVSSLTRPVQGMSHELLLESTSLVWREMMKYLDPPVKLYEDMIHFLPDLSVKGIHNILSHLDKAPSCCAPLLWSNLIKLLDHSSASIVQECFSGLLRLPAHESTVHAEETDPSNPSLKVNDTVMLNQTVKIQINEMNEEENNKLYTKPANLNELHQVTLKLLNKRWDIKDVALSNMKTLIHHQTLSWLPMLLPLIQDPHAYVRASCLKVLAKVPFQLLPSSFQQTLPDCLQDSEAVVRREALKCLLGWQRAWIELILSQITLWMRDGDEEVRMVVVELFPLVFESEPRLGQTLIRLAVICFDIDE